jgi:hypothetical protein
MLPCSSWSHVQTESPYEPAAQAPGRPTEAVSKESIMGKRSTIPTTDAEAASLTVSESNQQTAKHQVANDQTRFIGARLCRSGLSTKIAITVGLVLSQATVAAPPDHPDPALAPWFESLKQPGTGVSCCSVADCRTVEFRQDRDGYEVLIDGRWKMSIPFWLRVPPNRIIDRIDNPTNRAVVCFTPEGGILCFVRPSES